jgi:hypothetical protein
MTSIYLKRRETENANKPLTFFRWHRELVCSVEPHLKQMPVMCCWSLLPLSILFGHSASRCPGSRQLKHTYKSSQYETNTTISRVNIKIASIWRNSHEDWKYNWENAREIWGKSEEMNFSPWEKIILSFFIFFPKFFEIFWSMLSAEHLSLIHMHEKQKRNNSDWSNRK